MPRNSEFFTGNELLDRWEMAPFELKDYIKERDIRCFSPSGRQLIEGIYVDIVIDACHRKGERLDEPSTIDYLKPENLSKILISKEDVFFYEGYKSLKRNERKHTAKKDVLCYLLKEKRKKDGINTFENKEAGRKIFPGRYPQDDSYADENAAQAFRRSARRGENKLTYINEKDYARLQEEADRIYRALNKAG